MAFCCIYQISKLLGVAFSNTPTSSSATSPISPLPVAHCISAVIIPCGSMNTSTFFYYRLLYELLPLPRVLWPQMFQDWAPSYPLKSRPPVSCSETSFSTSWKHHPLPSHLFSSTSQTYFLHSLFFSLQRKHWDIRERLPPPHILSTSSYFSNTLGNEKHLLNEYQKNELNEGINESIRSA